MYAPEQKSLIEAAGQSGCAGVTRRQQVDLWRNSRGRGMKVVELYGRVRYAVRIEGLSRREAARQFGIDPRTVAKMLAFSVPPGCRRRRPPARRKLGRCTGSIDGILTADEVRPGWQRQ